MVFARNQGLRVVYDPDNDTEEYTSEVDLVLVHGFAGDVIETWTYKDDENSVFWPRDLLTHKRPQTRILSFGYEMGEMVTIRDCARTLLVYLSSHRGDDANTRPIVFLGHCLGGLIIKQALRFALKERIYSSIAAATKSIMFFGTPHGGGKKTQWLEIARRSKVQGSKCKIIDVLSRNTDDLMEIDEDFRQLTTKYDIMNFFETRPMIGAKSLVVDKTSANLTYSAEFQSLPVDADHISICKFVDDVDPPFIEICRVIKEAVGIKANTKKADVKGPVVVEAVIKDIVIKGLVIREVGIEGVALNAKGQDVLALEEAETLQASQLAPRQRLLEFF
ncbi:hypothetical protein F4825DRAFT_425661 [Nemania diffusa]|nr:hypothetical protein F4825DRAFT_425661 [Nemania diffusa]